MIMSEKSKNILIFTGDGTGKSTAVLRSGSTETAESRKRQKDTLLRKVGQEKLPEKNHSRAEENVDLICRGIFIVSKRLFYL